MTLFLNMSHSVVLGVRISTFLFEGYISTNTRAISKNTVLIGKKVIPRSHEEKSLNQGILNLNFCYLVSKPRKYLEMQDWHRDEYGARERNMKHYQKKSFLGMYCALNLKTNTGNKNINPGEILKKKE